MEKHALITGASGGIGGACARLLAKNGFDIGIGCRNAEKGRALSDAIRRAGGYGVVCPGDVRKAEDVRAIVETMKRDIGMPDTLVLCAGVAHQQLFQLTDEDAYDRIMDTNVKGAYLVIREVLPSMISAKRGCIILVSSMWGQTGGSCETLYSASKAALIGMTKALAKEVGPSGIRVNCVAPGVIETDMTLPLGRETLDSLAEDTPLCRNGTPDDVAQAVLWLSGKGAGFVTGQIIGVNGGLVV